eukprot:TRINITY_DN63442_c0_g1_i1.p1 TRINITY_DN63442_c0_g1~~TRINITY_DN63442_c0_g1_i1.p1  ORF type:complete len:384 (+),score=24.98 TRINITY_DN63442_c0_g1_i1:71-1222(+)
MAACQAGHAMYAGPHVSSHASFGHHRGFSWRDFCIFHCCGHRHHHGYHPHDPHHPHHAHWQDLFCFKCLGLEGTHAKDQTHLQPSSWSGQKVSKTPHGLFAVRRRIAEWIDISRWAVPTLKNHPQNATMFLCVPRRTAVFTTALLHCVYSWLEFFFRAWVHKKTVMLFGGFSTWGHVVVQLLASAGCVFGVFGVIGALYMRGFHLRCYQWYLLAHLPGAALMYYFDLPVVLDCELWMTDYATAMKKHGWSPAMFDIALNGVCSEDRILFFVLSILMLLLLLYIVQGTQSFLSELEQESRYLLRPPDGPSGAFRAVDPTLLYPGSTAFPATPGPLINPGVGACGRVGEPFGCAGSLPSLVPTPCSYGPGPCGYAPQPIAGVPMP